ncbi:MAG: D-alanyl-D-alanine carboxypeptidase/D-alanyl-D-alanine endopeptidase [Longimicrobiales bacterium]
MPPGASRTPVLLILAAGGLAFSSIPSKSAPDIGPGASVVSPAFPTADPESGPPEDAPVPAEIVELRRDLEQILRATGNENGVWAVLAVSLDRGDTLLAMNPTLPMVPASNQKLLTTAAALHWLGPDFRYHTFLLSGGPVEDGVLGGDLVLYGTGDPTLSRRFFPGETAAMDTLAQRVIDAGIREIKGDLVVDGSYFSGPELHPEWDTSDLNDPFAAPVSSVMFNENLVTVQVLAEKAPYLQPTVVTHPEGSEIPVVNIAVTTPPGTRSRIWLFRESPSDPIGIEGEIPVGGRDVWRELPIPEPLVYAGMHLRRALEARGIVLVGGVRINRDPALSVLPPDLTVGTPEHQSPRVVGVVTSPPLLEILKVINKESHNLFAEAVAKTLGRLTVGRGSFEGGNEAIGRFLAREVGVPASQVTLRDGSGLSVRNQVSAGTFVQVLQFLAESPEWDRFWSTLPQAGFRRELGRMSGSAAARNLRAKTGTMEGVSALSGMVRTRSGERVLFSIIANGVTSEFRAKRAEDQLGIRLASFTRPTEPPPLPDPQSTTSPH